MTREQHEGFGDITCRDSVSFVSRLRDSELDDGDRQRLQLHLNSCPRCQIARQQFERMFKNLDLMLDRSPRDERS